MKLHLSKELKAGLIVLLVAAAMYWLVYFLKGRDIFNRVTSYRVQYENVEGINVTGPVYIRGLKVGMVKKILYNPQKDLFDVTLQLESRYAIPANSVAQIFSVDLLGTKAIRIRMGNAARILEQNDLLPSDIDTGFIDYVAGALPSLKEQISGLLTGLDSTVKNLNVLLGAQNQAHLEASLARLSEALREFRTLGSGLNSALPQVHSILYNLDRFSTTLEASSAHLKETLSHLALFTDTLTHAPVAKTVRDLDLLINQMKNPDGSIGKLLNSDQMHQQVIRLLQNLDTLISNISQNPKKYFKISVF